MSVDDELRAARDRIAALEREAAEQRALVQDARFVEALRARLAQVAAAGRLATPTDHSALLEQIVQTAMHVLHALAGSLYLVDERDETLVFEVALGERAEPLRGRRIPLGEGVAGWVAATGQALGVADVQQDPRWAEEVGRAVGYAPRTMVAVPLMLRERVLGVLQLLDKDGGRPFSAEDLTTLGQFANQAAVAIDQSRTVRSLTALLRAALTTLDQDALVGNEGDLASFVAHTEASAAYQDTMQLAAHLGRLARQGESGRRLALDITTAITTYLQGRPRLS